jgi:hypothetical protein
MKVYLTTDGRSHSKHLIKSSGLEKKLTIANLKIVLRIAISRAVIFEQYFYGLQVYRLQFIHD